MLAPRLDSGTGYHVYVSNAVRRVLYLHGFASSPRSRKAEFFRENLAAEGLAMEALDLADRNFANLTLTGQLMRLATRK